MHGVTSREIETWMEELRGIEPPEAESRGAVARAMGGAASRREVALGEAGGSARRGGGDCGRSGVVVVDRRGAGGGKAAGGRGSGPGVSRMDLLLIDDRIDQKLEGDGFAMRHRVSFDGRQTVFWNQTSAIDQVTVAPERKGWVDVQAKQWSALNLLCPPKTGKNGVDDQSLELLLAAGLSRVRPNLEEVEGRWCHVVEAPGGTFWLDVERGSCR